jgi:polyhydroxybutyrate depolymerase
MLDFHGFGHSAAGVWRVSRFRDLAATDPFIAVYPDGIPVRFSHRGKDYDGPGWDIRTRDGNRDLAFVTLLLDRLEREYCIDRARIFVTGFSNGGFFSHLLGCTMPERFAAIAPVGAGQRPDPCAPSRTVPVLIFHGRQDQLIEVADARSARDAWLTTNRCQPATPSSEAVQGASCARFAACRDGATVESCEGDFGHHWPEPATARVWAFFKAHPLAQEGVR